MSRVIRLDETGHTTLAEWRADDPEAIEAAVRAFREELDRGYFAMVLRRRRSGRAGARAAGRRRPDDLRLPISAADSTHPWRASRSQSGPRSTGARAWTRSAYGTPARCGRRQPSHVAPFVGAGVALFLVEPLAAPVTLASFAHAWVIPELYAQRGAKIARPPAVARARRRRGELGWPARRPHGPGQRAQGHAALVVGAPTAAR
jgi:hypothetical protein